MNPNKLTAEEVAMLNETAELYKRYHKDVVENGDVYYGDYYMNVGLNCSQEWHQEFECQLFVLEEAE